jgi:endonuclease-3 related protein
MQSAKLLSAPMYEVFQRLLAEHGPQHWWPGDTPFEVMVGAQGAVWPSVR